MNAVERLWRSLGTREFHRAEGQMHPNAVIRLPASGQTFASREEYIRHHVAAPEDRVVKTRLVVHEGKHVAVHVTITVGHEVSHGAGFYELQEGRIAHGVEVWADAPQER